MLVRSSGGIDGLRLGVRMVRRLLMETGANFIELMIDSQMPRWRPAFTGTVRGLAPGVTRVGCAESTRDGAGWDASACPGFLRARRVSPMRQWLVFRRSASSMLCTTSRYRSEGMDADRFAVSDE